MDELFKRMTMAYLHDPPCKALDYSQTHKEIADAFMKTTFIDGQSAGTGNLVDNEWTEDKENNPDHAAAAADRVIFPKAKINGGFDWKVKHPLCSSEMTLKKIELGQAIENLQNSFNGIKASSWKDFFFLLWRQWKENTGKIDRDMVFYPADTRIPDHSIWHHMDLTAAMEACRNESTGKITPCMMMFKLGPVQDFIANARSTRDLWSGSYLIAWLTAHAVKAVTDEVGPTAIIFPSLRNQGVFDAVNKEIYKKVSYGDKNGKSESLWERLYNDRKTRQDAVNHLLNPTIPNRFFAILPEDKAEAISKKAEKAVIDELKNISEDCFKKFKEISGDDLSRWEERWNKQVELFPQIVWQTMPFRENVEAAIAAMDEFSKDSDQKKTLEQMRKIACEHIPESERDERNYEDEDKKKLKRPEFAWSANYAELSAAMAARSNTRDFKQFKTDGTQNGSPKDALSGKEEIIGDTELWEKRICSSGYFKDNEGPYGAITIIKRLWCLQKDSYLCKKLEVNEDEFRGALKYDSVEAVAEKNDSKSKKNDSKSKYVAIIAIDGDEMGKWISGAKNPAFIDQLSDNAKEYFEKLFKEKNIDSSKLKRMITPAFHLQFSESLANFANFIASKIVEHFKGELIYAGGDDVLAMLPADKAFACARTLRSRFRGEAYNGSSFEEYYSPARGFVNIGKETTLTVPGPSADVSCGIAIGHFQYPLQSMVKEAQAAEKRAKGKYNRGAMAVSLLKRGGEIIHWGAKWDSPAWMLYDEYLKLSNSEEVSGKFPNAIAQLLAPYQLEKEAGEASISCDDLKEIIEEDFWHVVKQQGGNATLTKLQKDGFEDVVTAYLDELQGETKESKRFEDFANLFLTAAFIHRDRE